MGGDHVNEVIRKCIAAAPSKSEFNGTWIVVNNRSETVEAVYSRFNNDREQAYAVWVESKKGKAYTRKESKKKIAYQKEIDQLIQQLADYSLNEWNVEAAIMRLKDFAIKADNASVSFDKQYIIDKLMALGIKRNTRVGDPNVTNNNFIIGGWLPGQALGGLYTVRCPQPVCAKFCVDYEKMTEV